MRHRSACGDGATPAALRGEVDAIVADCGELVAAAIARATGHAQACARRAIDIASEARPQFAIARLANRSAQALVASGRAVDGVHRMLDVLALASDWTRGGRGLLGAALSAAIVGITTPYLHAAVGALAPATSPRSPTRSIG